MLVVDDSQDEVDLLRRALSSHVSLEIAHVARDGQDALDYLLHEGEFLDQSAPAPDLILLDLHMPRVDGLEVLRRVKSDELLALIPVVMFSSSNRAEDIADCYRLGANTYIQKPAAFQEYARTISLLAQYWGALAQLPPQQHRSGRAVA